MDRYPQYNLRDRNTIQPPARFTTSTHEEINLNENITRLRQQCAAKRKSIDKRIERINTVISEQGSRTKLLMLRGQLQRVSEEITRIHTQLSLLRNDGEDSFDADWLEDLSILLDECYSNVEEHIAERADEPPSRALSEYDFEESELDTHSVKSDRGPRNPSGYMEGWQRENLNLGEMTTKMSNLSMERGDQNMVLNEGVNLINAVSPAANPEVTFNPLQQDPEVTFNPLQQDPFLYQPEHQAMVEPLISQFENLPAVTDYFAAQPSIPAGAYGGMYAEEVISAVQGNTESFPYSTESCLDDRRTSTSINLGTKLKTVDQYTSPLMSCKEGLPSSVQSTNSQGHDYNSIKNVVSVGMQSGLQFRNDTLDRFPSYRRENSSRYGIASTSDPRNKGRGEPSSYQGSHTNNNPINTRQCDASTYPAANERAVPLQTEARRRHEASSTLKNPTVLHGNHIPVRKQHSVLPNDGQLVDTNRQLIDSAPPQRNLGQYRTQISGMTLGGENSVDGWIDMLPRNEHQHDTSRIGGIPAYAAANRWLMNQNLPTITIPKFNGDALMWVEFVTHFKEMVHEQPYLTTAQRMTYLLQYLEGDAKKSVKGFGNEWNEYTRALRRLKFMFGQKIRIAQSYLFKVTRGKAVRNDDIEGLTDLYYDISDCLSNLHRLHYNADLRSTDVLHQVLQRLPPRLLDRWAEHSYKLRRNQEPTLMHLESWLEDRVMAVKDSYLPSSSVPRRTHIAFATGLEEELQPRKQTYPNQWKMSCPICKDEHHLSKCTKFTTLSLEDRVKIVEEKNLCYNCLKTGHISRKCNSRNCFNPGCKQKHHTMLHDHFNKRKPANEDNLGNAAATPTEDSKELKVASTLEKGKYVYCKVVCVKVKVPGNEDVQTYAFLDDGSDGTFIKAEFAKSIGLTGNAKSISISTILDKEEHIVAESVSFDLAGADPESEIFSIKDATALPRDKFKLRSQYLPPKFHSGEYQHLQGLGLKDVQEVDITILIGLDNYQAIMIQEIKQGARDEPIAARTSLGWTIFGSEEGRIHDNMSLKVNHLRLEELVQSFWETESFGTEFQSSKPTSIQDQSLLQKMKTTSTRKHDHMVVNMLWKDGSEQLPNSYSTAEKRYYSLRNRLMKNPELLERYGQNIKDYIEKGYARKMSMDELMQKHTKVWYLPHHPVFHPFKPGKVRIVFDAAAKTEGLCLNDHLHIGPDLTSKLIGVLLRFRNYPVAIVADIEAMFHQVWVGEEDSQCLRFLWSENLCSTEKPDVFQMLVHIFGARDSPCCASFALKQTAVDNQDKFTKEAVETVLKEFYVDDLLKSVKTTNEARELIKEVKEMLMINGFKLTKFVSNHQSALKGIDESDQRKPVGSLQLEKSNIERALGIIWEINNDTFTFSSSSIKEAPFTKRGVLRVLSSVYDPLGFLAPFVIKAKIILQNLWRRGCNWDEPLTHGEQAQWSKWLVELKEVSTFKIRRWHADNLDIKSRELHIFVDASQSSFGAVSYIRVLYNTGKVSCYLLMSKSRLAPIKTLTIPRLELQAAVLGIRLYSTINEEIALELDRIHFWTDSLITLQYLHNKTRRFKVFVANRVSEIHDHSNINQWSHVPGELNPADDMTRGLSIKDIREGSRWIQGPHFLYIEETEWPSCKHIEAVDQNDEEVRKMVMSTNVSCSLAERLKNYSSWQKMLNVVGWALRFIHNTKREIKGHLKVSELRRATNVVVRLSQEESFPEELKALKENKAISTGSKLLPLQPYISEKGIIRVGGRLRKANISMEARHQIILDAKSWISKLLVTHQHRMNIDEGPLSLLASLRQRFWVVGAKQLVKKVIKACFECRKRSSNPVVPVMADLPEYRVKFGCPVFFHTGVDFFGPILTKFRRGTIKRWGSIFTCMSTRAIHLEVVEGMDTDSFINTLRRFVNRRGNPKQMISDCGSNFKGADAELKRALRELDNSKVGKYAAGRDIDWRFNPPDAPHMGGAWERLVRTVKLPLKLMLKDKIVTDFQLITIFTEIESIVNSRPLTPVSDSIDDYEALTPNHFLIGRASANLPITAHYKTDICSRKRWRQVQFLANHFWRRWMKEYLPSITTRPKWHKDQENIKPGDLVLMVEDDLPRGKWKLSRVTRVFPGDDGVVRIAEVKSSAGTYIRPVAKLCCLEEAAT